MLPFLNGVWVGAVLALVGVGVFVRKWPHAFDDFIEYFRK